MVRQQGIKGQRYNKMPHCQSQLPAIHMWMCLTFAPCLQAFRSPSIKIVGLFLGETWHCLYGCVFVLHCWNMQGGCSKSSGSFRSCSKVFLSPSVSCISQIFFSVSILPLLPLGALMYPCLFSANESKGKLWAYSQQSAITHGQQTNLNTAGKLNTHNNKWLVYLPSLFQHAQELYTMNLATLLLPPGLWPYMFLFSASHVNNLLQVIATKLFQPLLQVFRDCCGLFHLLLTLRHSPLYCLQ